MQVHLDFKSLCPLDSVNDNFAILMSYDQSLQYFGDDTTYRGVFLFSSLFTDNSF